MNNVATISDHQESQELVLASSKPMKLMEIAISKGADLASLEKLMDLQERWEAGLAKKEFFAALSAFQSEIPVIPKNGKASFGHKQGGGNTEYTYAFLDDIARAIRPFLAKHGLSYRYEQKVEQTNIAVCCYISHSSGHQEKASMSAFPDKSGKKNEIQQQASTVSYLRRYTLTGALGITAADVDDDGHNSETTQETVDSSLDNKNYYPQDRFDQSFPNWEKKIRAGKKKVHEIIGFVNGKGFSLTDAQLAQIGQLGE
jgi:hypothetical protein